jgi:queuosine precursor transporter
MRTYAPLAVAFTGLVVLANWLASKYLITVPLTDLVAPAGVLAIGAVLVLRDWIQALHGLWKSLPLVYAAGLISYVVGIAAGWTSLQKIALASVIAFTVSETVEALVFTPLRRRHLSLGVLLSGFAGNALDSWIFLSIAFGSLAFFWGQFVGKGEMIVIGTALTLVRRRVLPVTA